MPEPAEIGHQVRFSNSLIGLFRKACWEIPEIMCSSALALVGIGLAIYGVNRYIKNDGANTEYKQLYTVMRPGDPRECRLRNPVFTKYEC